MSQQTTYCELFFGDTSLGTFTTDILCKSFETFENLKETKYDIQLTLVPEIQKNDVNLDVLKMFINGIVSEDLDTMLPKSVIGEQKCDWLGIDMASCVIDRMTTTTMIWDSNPEFVRFCARMAEFVFDGIPELKKAISNTRSSVLKQSLIKLKDKAISSTRCRDINSEIGGLFDHHNPNVTPSDEDLLDMLNKSFLVTKRRGIIMLYSHVSRSGDQHEATLVKLMEEIKPELVHSVVKILNYWSHDVELFLRAPRLTVVNTLVNIYKAFWVIFGDAVVSSNKSMDLTNLVPILYHLINYHKLDSKDYVSLFGKVMMKLDFNSSIQTLNSMKQCGIVDNNAAECFWYCIENLFVQGKSDWSWLKSSLQWSYKNEVITEAQIVKSLLANLSKMDSNGSSKFLCILMLMDFYVCEQNVSIPRQLVSVFTQSLGNTQNWNYLTISEVQIE